MAFYWEAWEWAAPRGQKQQDENHLLSRIRLFHSAITPTAAMNRSKLSPHLFFFIACSRIPNISIPEWEGELATGFRSMAPFSIPTSTTWGSRLFHMIAGTRYCLAILVGVAWCLIFLMASVSLMCSAVEHHWPFVCLLWRNVYWVHCLFFSSV